VRVDQALEGVARPAQLAGEGWLEFGLVATGRRRRRRLWRRGRLRLGRRLLGLRAVFVAGCQNAPRRV